MKILIVDDDAVSSGVLQQIVSGPDSGNQVTVASEAKAAWSLLDDPARYFDVAFIDLSMPEMDGFQLLQRIRQNPLLHKLEVVICTGSRERASLAKAVQLGARHYLVKPCTKEGVLAKLHQICPPDPTAERRLVGAA